ncbi:MAG: site-specific integrase [Deltaproteobacteria bacterium]|nr:site-specific integrase [Deltaproteobacteria bacterium]
MNTRDGAMAYERQLREEVLRHGSMARFEETVARPREVPTFAAFAVRWMAEYVASNNKTSERRNKATVLRAHLVPTFGTHRLDQIRTADIEQYKADAQGRGLAPKTINNHLVILRRCLATAVEWDIPLTLPRFKPLRVPPQGFRFLSPSEIGRLVCFAAPPWRTMIALAADTGLRFSELIALDWTDVDLAARRLTVRRGCVLGVFDSPKNNRIRHLRLTAEAAVAIEELPHRGGLLFTHRGKLINDETARRHLAEACRGAGIEPIGWHALRHSFASELIRRGASVFSVKELLGHQSVEVTMRYAHLGQETLDESVLLLERREKMSTWRQPAPLLPNQIEGAHPRFSARITEKAVRNHGLLCGSEGGDRTAPGGPLPNPIRVDPRAQ